METTNEKIVYLKRSSRMKFAVLILISIFTLNVNAQEFGAMAGIHNGKSDLISSSLSSENVLGYRLGILMKTELTESVQFRSGLIYTVRNTEHESAGVFRSELDLSYLDIPVLFEFNMSEIVSVFAGPVVAINVGDNKKDTNLTTGASTQGSIDDVESLYLLAQVGVSFNFDGIGFDVYYERGLGEYIKDGAEDFSAYGANFVLWF
jgi:hypothetical protein